MFKRLRRVVEKASHVSNLPASAEGVRHQIPGVDGLAPEDLERLNDLLPWACFVLDTQGRRFGKPYSSSKRAVPETVPDSRIVELDRRVSLADKHVLELGCFEGLHTCALAHYARKVTALDARIENVVKTIVRCHLFGYKPDVVCVDLEKTVQAPQMQCDVLHHVGVLYHLTDPVAHLKQYCKITGHSIMLDTHVADPGEKLLSYSSGGKRYRYYHLHEGPRAAPFAGMRAHAKWLLEEELIGVLSECGFGNIEVAERRLERNGPRVLIYAHR